MVMADNGATVTHIEPPPDSGRPADPSKAGAGYRQWQRGKETLALDLKDPQDAGRARQLAHEADVLVEAFRPGVMDRLGLGYEPVAQANPSLVYCSITGFGTRGKYQNVKGYEAVVAAVAGRLVDEGNTFGLGRPGDGGGADSKLRRFPGRAAGHQRGPLHPVCGPEWVSRWRRASFKA